MTPPDLRDLRSRFPILERSTYLISNSLGAMPLAARAELAAYAEDWETRGVRAWHEGWWEMAVETGDLVAPLLGVAPGTVSSHLNVTLATAVFLSCLDYPPERRRILATDLDFPSLSYLMDGESRRGADVHRLTADDGPEGLEERLLEAIDERVRVVVVSHALFKTAYLLDPRRLAERCRRAGALLLLDVYQTAGVMPLRLAEWGVDAAVGGTLKWLCGGPGVAYLWIRPELASTLEPALTGWQADKAPFEFRSGPIRRADGAWRFLTGTPNVPGLHACRPGLRVVREVGPGWIRRRSLALTDRIIERALAAGFEIATPRDHHRRGGTVTVSHPDSERLCAGLLEREIVCDHRPGAGVRLSPHFYNTEAECDLAVETLAELAG